jgi:hypothetical protein
VIFRIEIAKDANTYLHENAPMDDARIWVEPGNDPHTKILCVETSEKNRHVIEKMRDDFDQFHPIRRGRIL